MITTLSETELIGQRKALTLQKSYYMDTLNRINKRIEELDIILANKPKEAN